MAAHPRLQRKFEVLAHRVARIERVVLEDQRDVALGALQLAHVLAVDADRCRAVGLLEPGDQTERRRLAGAGRAEEDEELAVGDRRASGRSAPHGAPNVLVTLSSLICGHGRSRACTGSDSPVREAEEMGLRLVELRPDGVARLADIAARGARAQQLLADLEVDDVVGAERLDDVRLDRDVALGAPRGRRARPRAGRRA